MRSLKIISVISIIIASFVLFGNKRYHNIDDIGEPNFIEFMRWKLARNKPVWPKLAEVNPNINKANLAKTISGDDIQVTYINHSSFLIQVGGKNIITDPIWSSHAGPFGKLGVKRSVYPGLNIEDLPPIDFILISHSHYDHLDLPTIENITKNHNPQIITGMGVTHYIDYCKKSPERCFEMQWWENTKTINSEVIFNFVPAHHWSSRYLLDKNITLWGGFVIQHKNKNIYFAGDTGFSDGKLFQTIKDKYGEFRLSLLPIGAYKPSWFFSPMHISPAEAVKIFKILNSTYAVPMHFEVFELADDGYKDPIIDLKKALQTEGIQEYKFNIMQPGNTWLLPK
jgi:L-ascorbate metabolism protein UlaG (beta-lactamase superfamily)